jgi:hypothetical protein
VERSDTPGPRPRLFRRLRGEKVALRADLIPAQSSKKRGQRSAVSDQLRPLEPSSCEHRNFFAIFIG